MLCIDGSSAPVRGVRACISIFRYTETFYNPPAGKARIVDYLMLENSWTVADVFGAALAAS